MGYKFRFSQRSLQNLDVHEDLQRVALRALELASVDFIVVDGGRTIEEQQEYVRTGKSRTMQSRHLGGFALDFAPWYNNRVVYRWDLMKAVADAFKQAGEEVLGPGRIEWGGDWKSFKDGPHIQLSKVFYPDKVG